MKQLLFFIALVLLGSDLHAQELQAKINTPNGGDSTTKTVTFSTLATHTAPNFSNFEYLDNNSATVYDAGSNRFTCTALVQANRPVYNSSYNTTLYNNNDKHFDFEFVQYDQLNFNEEVIDNQLVALFAYYAYLIIGLDLDSFSPMGGTDVLQRCMNLTNNAQNLDFAGWKSFEDSRNRFAIINDYLDEAMKPFRQLQYDYYRQGLDEMAQNVERGRTNVTTTLETNLKKAHEDKPLSLLPQIWTDFKKDELANIYKGKGTQKEKESVYDVLFGINASQNATWEKIKN